MATSSRRDNYRFLILEGLMVLLSVLAALVMDDWRQNREVMERVTVAVERVVTEVIQNQGELEELVGNATARRDALGRMLEEAGGSRSLANRINEFGGYPVPDLSRAAWERVNSGAVADHVPEAFLDDAFDLYTLDGQYQSLADRIDEVVYSRLFFDADQARLAMLISWRILDQEVVWARILLGRYEIFLEKYGSEGSETPLPDSVSADSSASNSALPDTSLPRP